jgi:hypothetical protein
VDGPTAGSFLGNQYCRTNLGLYVYFRIADSFCVSNAVGQAATVEIEYFDNTPSAVLKLHYDSLTNNYATHPISVTTTGNGGWKNFRWTVTNAFFGNRQNSQSDFRIEISVGKTVAIRRASVFLPEEQNPGAVAGRPRLDRSGNTLKWNATEDASGWRLFKSSTLNSASWQEVTSGLVFTQGTVQHSPPFNQPAQFYHLQRPQRK